MLGRGISINATTVAVMSVLGPTIGSAILSVAPWPWIFAVNLPVCVLAMLGLRHLPEVPRNNVAFDGISALLSMATLGVFISGVDMMGADLLRGIGLVAIAAVLGIVLMRRASGQTAPLVPVDLLRIRPLAYAVAASACTFAAQMASYVSLPFYFQQVLGRPYLEVGMLMGAWPVGTALVAPLAGRLSDRYSPATMSGIGAATMVAGMLWLALLPTHVSNAPFWRACSWRAWASASSRRRTTAPCCLPRRARAAAPPAACKPLPGVRPELRHRPGRHRLQPERGPWPRPGAGAGHGLRRAGGGGERHPLQPAADALAALPATT